MIDIEPRTMVVSIGCRGKMAPIIEAIIVIFGAARGKRQVVRRWGSSAY